MKHDIIKTDDYLLVVDESEIKEGEYTYYPPPIGNGGIGKAIITQQGWNKNIIAHLPLNNSPILEGVDVLPPLDNIRYDFAEMFYNILKTTYPTFDEWPEAIEYNKAREKYKYTESDIKKVIKQIRVELVKHNNNHYSINFDEIIQSLSQPKMPIGFECETETRVYDTYPETRTINPKTTTTPEGHTQWVGTYIFN